MPIAKPPQALPIINSSTLLPLKANNNHPIVKIGDVANIAVFLPILEFNIDPTIDPTAAVRHGMLPKRLACLGVNWILGSTSKAGIAGEE